MDGVSVALGTTPEHAWSYVFFKLFTESFCSEAHPLSFLLLFASLGTPLADSVWGREAGRRAHPYSRMSQLNLRWRGAPLVVPQLGQNPQGSQGNQRVIQGEG